MAKKAKIRTPFTDAVATPKNGLTSPKPASVPYGKSKK
jgi:hypothetical protein